MPPVPGCSALRIDKTHTPWIVGCSVAAVAAVGLHAWLGRDTPRGLGGGSRVGLLFGIAGSLLMLGVGLLSVHRRLPVRRRWGRRSTWLRAHLWLGLLSVVLVLCHSGYRWGGPLTIALGLSLAVVTLSGLFGMTVQHLMPRLMTERVTEEAPYEQIPYLCKRMRQEADEAFVLAASRAGLTGEAAHKLAALHGDARRFLGDAFDRHDELADPIKADVRFREAEALVGTEEGGKRLGEAQQALARVRTMIDERRQLGHQAAMHRLLHWWLLAHVPATVALLVLGVAHVFTVIW